MIFNKLKTIELMLGSVFNIMALIRTIIAVLFVFFALGCANIEFAYSEALWVQHQIHFQEGDTRLECAFCQDYQRKIP